LRDSVAGNPAVKVFDTYAEYYDLLYSEKNYAAEASYVAGLIRSSSADTHRLLELGCGTGGLAFELAKLGFDVTGVDLSECMLARAHAARKCKSLGSPSRSSIPTRTLWTLTTKS
jgi:predicted TPR repeat methyltransferase